MPPRRPTSRDVHVRVSDDPRVPPALAIGLLVSPAEQERIDAMRVRSYELALQRGHIRR